MVVRSADFNPAESEGNGWREVPIAWGAIEAFAPSFVRGPVGPRLLLWSGNDAQWVNPLLAGGDTTTYWTSSLNFTTDVQ
jgi:hypothetical protein